MLACILHAAFVEGSASDLWGICRGNTTDIRWPTDHLGVVWDVVECFLHPINHILANGWRKLNMLFIYHFWHHGTTAWTGTTCNKIFDLFATQPASGLLLKILKYFRAMLNIFEFSHVKENWLVYVNKFSWIIQSCFLIETIKRS